jgi:hypothetical protein
MADILYDVWQLQEAPMLYEQALAIMDEPDEGKKE